MVCIAAHETNIVGRSDKGSTMSSDDWTLKYYWAIALMTMAFAGVVVVHAISLYRI
jgi:hypothetical protein